MKTPYWTKVIATALKKKAAGKPGPYFIQRQMDKANDWVTCACGKQDPRIPRKSWLRSFAPEDDRLRVLGLLFAEYLDIDNPEGALKCLEKIERRSAKILAGIKNE